MHFPQVSQALSKISEDPDHAGIIRASALDHMQAIPD